MDRAQQSIALCVNQRRAAPALYLASRGAAPANSEPSATALCVRAAACSLAAQRACSLCCTQFLRAVRLSGYHTHVYSVFCYTIKYYKHILGELKWLKARFFCLCDSVFARVGRRVFCNRLAPLVALESLKFKFYVWLSSRIMQAEIYHHYLYGDKDRSIWFS